MSNISEEILNKMEYYDIKDLEALSTIKAHTIRIWEKRYGLLEPDRTDTNIRKYDSIQLKKLLNISQLLEQGMKISAIANLSEKEIEQKLLKEPPGETSTESSFIHALITALIDYDIQTFESKINAVIVRYGLLNGVNKVIYPFLQKTGILWTTNNLMPVQEHMMVNIIRQKIIAAIDGIERPLQPDKKKIILFLPSNEYHEIGLLLAHYILVHKGYSCIYLGQNVPFDNVAVLVEKYKKVKFLTFIHERNIDESFHEFVDLHHADLWIACDKKVVPLIKHYKSLTYIHSTQDLEKLIRI